MPRQNRVTPFSTLIATSACGTLMGNRGCLHDDRGQIRRAFRGQRWIICLLEFKNRHNTIMTPGHYTELFFLDEATALAAGHRPCAECQRDRFNLFREFWSIANPDRTAVVRPVATLIDAVLHAERLAPHSVCNTLDDLPDGAFITDDEQTAYLVLNHQLWRWTPFGYENAAAQPINYPTQVLTPAAIVRTLAAGYPVTLHTSAAHA
jgi:hypothetical protein